MRKNILITGMPKSGKSTVLQKIITPYEHKVGFLTREIRNQDERVGFQIETHSGRKITLAHVDFKTEYKVSKYSVEINNLELILPEVSLYNPEDILYIDEIGQMQLLSEQFKQLVLNYLHSPNICLITLSKVYAHPFIEQVKNRTDVILVEITEQDRAIKQEYIQTLIAKIGKASRYLQNQKRFTIQSDHATITTDHGLRSLMKNNGIWNCSCQFFKEHRLCSHTLAVEELLNTNGS